MGLLDLFRPRWRHSDPEVRLEAVKQLSEGDEAILRRVVISDGDLRVRRQALKRVSDLAVLDQVAEGDADDGLKRAAAEKTGELRLAGALKAANAPAARPFLDKLPAKALGEVAKRGAAPEVRRAALAKIDEPRVLADVARRGEEPVERLEAVSRIPDGEVLRELALAEPARDVALAAIAKVHDRAFLGEAAERAKCRQVREEARRRLGGDAPAEAKRAGKPGRRAAVDATPEAKRRARRAQLAAQVEKAAMADDVEAAQAEVSRVQVEWLELGSTDDALEVRFQKALKMLDEKAADRLEVVNRVRARQSNQAEGARSGESEAAAAEAARAEREQRDRESAAARDQHKVAGEQERAQKAERATELADEAEKLSGSPKEVGRRYGKLEREFRTVEAGADEAVKARFRAVGERLEHLRAESEAHAREEREAERSRLGELCANLERLADEESLELKRADQSLKVAQDAFSSAQLSRDESAELRARYDAARAKLVARLSELREAEQWKRWANTPKLEALCVRVEKLAAEETDAKKVADELKAAQAEWKKVGAGPREKSEALWQRFKAASDKAFAVAQGYYEKLDEERSGRIAKREELCVQAEALSASTEWKETAEKLKALQEEWKAIGPVPRAQGDKLWKRFRAACDAFFDRSGEERQGNVKRLEELCERAEGLASSTQWRETSEQLKVMQAEWKEIGVAPRGEQQALWKRFRAACDAFFERRKGELDKSDGERSANLAKKEELVARAEALAEGAAASEAAREEARGQAKRLQQEWKRVGPAPRDLADAVWKKFRAACDRIFEEPGEEAGEEPAAAAAAATGGEVGIGGFTNRLPLDRLLGKEGAVEKAAPDEPTRKEKGRAQDDAAAKAEKAHAAAERAAAKAAAAEKEAVERAAIEAAAAAEREAAEKRVAAERAASEKKAAEDRLAAEQAASEKRAAADKLAAEQAASEKRAAADKLAAEQAASEKRAAADKSAAEQAASEKRAAAERAAAEQAASEKKAAAERAAAEQAASEKRAAAERAAADKLAAEQAASEKKAAAERAAAEQAASEKKAAAERAAAEKVELSDDEKRAQALAALAGLLPETQVPPALAAIPEVPAVSPGTPKSVPPPAPSPEVDSGWGDIDLDKK